MDAGLRVCFSGGHKNVPGGPPATGAEPTKAPAAVGGNPCHAGTKARLPADDCMWQAHSEETWDLSDGHFWPEDSLMALLTLCPGCFHPTPQGQTWVVVSQLPHFPSSLPTFPHTGISPNKILVCLKYSHGLQKNTKQSLSYSP